MNALCAALRRLLAWLEPGPPARAVPDQIGVHLRAAIAADTWAKAENVQSYEARVEAMIDDLSVKYGNSHGRDHS